jgi:uncharacterized membrane protein YbaN (DUF454 family)
MIWTAAGIVFLAIGIAGVILPMLPGTIFLFIASACFLRGSERLHQWLINHRVLGRHVRMVTDNEPMPRRAKVFAMAAMWAAVTFSIYATKMPAVQITLAVLALAGTWFIARR